MPSQLNFLVKANFYRNQNNLPEIRSSSVLLKAAKLRAESILNNEDYNSQETKSGILFITDVLKQVSYQKDGTVTAKKPKPYV